jgi:hypothetical protein
MRATYFNSFLAVSVLLLTIVCTTVPAWARVDIMANRTEEVNEVIISFDASTETNLVRAFALDIRLGTDANITEVTGISPDYYIYPGTIWIDAQGNVMDLGTPTAEYSDLPSGTLPGLDSNSITIEMASLYAPVGLGSPNAPAKFGDLVSIKVSGEFCVFTTCESCFPASEYCCITISANVARAGSTGVVMEDPNEVVDVNFHNICDYPPPPCYTGTQTAEWAAVGEPGCWCAANHIAANPRQCLGDAVGDTQGRNNYWTSTNDLSVLIAAWNKPYPDIAGQVEPTTGTPLICADFDHLPQGRQNYRVSANDLAILIANWNQNNLPGPNCP